MPCVVTTGTVTVSWESLADAFLPVQFKFNRLFQFSSLRPAESHGVRVYRDDLTAYLRSAGLAKSFDSWDTSD